MDDVDRAKEAEMSHRDDALKAATNRPIESQLKDDQGKIICIDCEEPLSTKRLEANPVACRCVDCQELKEKRIR